jgi:uncharacterized membrane protein
VPPVDTQVELPRPTQPLLPQTLPEWLLEFSALAALIAQFVIVFSAWPDIPDQVPQHFNASGEADAWGAKASLLQLPAVNFVVLLIMTAVSRFPHISSAPVEITPTNAARVYRLIRFQTIWLKAVLSFVFAYISWRMVGQALGTAQGLGTAFLPLTLIAVGSAVVWFYFELRQQRQTA